MDYGRPLQFGYSLVPNASNYQELLQTVRRIEELGLDLIGIQDHPYQRRFLDTWTLLAVIAAQTQRVRLFPDVANLPLRPPAVLAKAAASLDLMSNGRFELGIGAGHYWDAIKAMGGPVRDPKEAVTALEEAITVIRLMWSQERSVKFEGQFYSLRGVHPGPVPAHPIGIWIGAYGPRMLALTGRLGDGWIPSLPYLELEQIPGMQQRIDEAAATAGRDPATIQRLMNLNGSITEVSSGFLNGPVQQWVDELTELTLVYGIDSYLCDDASGRQLEQFAQEVVPQVRENVARARGQ